MTPRFSDRIQVTAIPSAVQVEGMNADLRNSLWNHLLKTVFSGHYSYCERAVASICEFFFKWPLDSLPAVYTQQDWLRGIFFDPKFAWFAVYNLIEFIATNCEGMRGDLTSEVFCSDVNVILQREMSGYRFITGILTPISNVAEVESISSSLQTATAKGLHGTQEHLQTAVALLSKKPTPDYRNSIKESISAVESLAKQITAEEGGGLDKALARLDAAVKFHGAFKAGLLSLYGYTSNDDGIRHAILEEPTVGFDEAKFMLVTCSALVNFMVAKADSAGMFKA